MNRPLLELADVIRAAADRLVDRHPAWFTWLHLKVLTAILRCRTAALGGHVDRVFRAAAIRPSLSTRALWGVFSNGEWRAERACFAERDAPSALHYDLAFSSASSLSGGRNLPVRRLGGTTASIASSFSVGSART